MKPAQLNTTSGPAPPRAPIFLHHDCYEGKGGKPAIPKPASTITVERGYTVRDDGEPETRLRKTATESSDATDFMDDWIANETLVDVLKTVVLENGSSFHQISVLQRKGTSPSIVGFLRTKYIRASEVSGGRPSKRQRS